MPNINIAVADKIATNTTPGVVIVCGNSDYLVTFDFDAEWAAEPNRVARFVYVKNGKSLYQEAEFTGNTVSVPKLFDVDYVLVGVYAGDLRTTTPAKVLCDRSILCGDPVAAQVGATIIAQIEQAVADYLEKNHVQAGGSIRIGSVVLLSDKWVTNGENLHYQAVQIPGVTANSQVDLTPSVEQLAVFHNKDLAFVTGNTGGVVTVYAIGQKPTNDYTIQVTIKEVSV